MKKILLVCAAGMSTSLLVNKMNDAAKEKGIEIDIFALPVSECSSVSAEVDVVLLGPQVRYQKPQVDAIIAGRVPVEVIEMRDYGMMNGKAILSRALDLMSQFEEN
ncbi:PTS sugar transporter subunit IIB [Actinomycetes bacterium NPDC127524]|jgi:cellobiose PTS system EIIB component|nr:PTS sugar transporter subunit IIB [Bacillus sp. OV322]SFC71382.1 PTS system, cellobiose-specific IIB component [Bacillus sp. OV322]